MIDYERRLIVSELKQILTKGEEENNYIHTMGEVTDRLKELIKALEAV